MEYNNPESQKTKSNPLVLERVALEPMAADGLSSKKPVGNRKRGIRWH
jgi:hypothetical protein